MGMGEVGTTRGTMLPNPGSPNPGVRMYVMEPIGKTNISPEACSEILDEGLQNHQHPHSDDC